MNLAEALDDALRGRYPVGGIKSPITQRRGLLGRMNALEKLHKRPGDKPGQAATRAAQSAGVAPRTWRDWRNGTHPPSAASQRKLEGAYTRQVTLPAYRKVVRTQRTPDKVKVTATIRWSSSPDKKYNASPHRTTTLTGMRRAMVPVVRAWAAAGPEAAADSFERAVSAVYKVADDDDGGPGVRFEGDQVSVEFP